MTGHHLVMGELRDYITGEILPDTHDERYRQKIARYLVEAKGYDPADIQPRLPVTVKAGHRKGLLRVDYLIRIERKICMVVKYGPGSLVTRYRPAIALSRLVAPYQVPVVAITNGEDVHILNGKSASVMGNGFEAIPEKSCLAQMVAGLNFSQIKPDRVEMESRIVYAYEIDGSCPCDDTVCRLP